MPNTTCFKIGNRLDRAIEYLRLTSAFWLGFLVASAPLAAMADDTDIYNSQEVLEQLGVRPNVLLVLDTSKSMDEDAAGSDQTRIQVMRAALKEILEDESLYGQINVGLARFNSSTGSIIYPVVELDETSADTLIDRLDNHMTPAGSTPLVAAYFEGVRYMLGMDVDGGLSRRYVGGDARFYGYKRYARISHQDTLTGGTWKKNSGRCDGMDSDDTDCAGEEWEGNPTYVSPITHQCQPNHIVVLTDGEANSNEAEDDIASLIGSACTDNRDNLECSNDLADYLYTTDLFDDSSKFGVTGEETEQKIITHTIAFNLSYPALEAIATAGGGNYYPADDAEKLAEAFTSLFSSFKDIDTTFVAPSAAVNQFNRLNHLDDIYFAVFRPKSTVSWPGNVKKYKLATGVLDDGGTPDDSADDLEVDNNTIVDRNNVPAVDPDTGFFLPSSSDFWSTENPTEFSVSEGGVVNKIPDSGAGRTIYTWLGGSMQRVSHENENITKAMLGLDDTVSEADWKSLRAWMAGFDTETWNEDNAVNDYRKDMGDPLHSQPTIVTYGRNGTSPILTMFFGTNDGYFRAIDANTGEEHFAFIPEEMFGEMKRRKNNASGKHIYGVDASPSVWVNDVNGDGTIDSDDGDHVYVYFGFRRGGTAYYALDVTDVNDPEVLWRIEKAGDFAELGQSWSQPIKTKIFYDTESQKNKFEPGEKDILIFAGGYDPNQDDIEDNVYRRTDTQGRAIYVVDAVDGSLLWKADSSTHSSMKYSIPARMSVIDPDMSGHADQMYVGDMGGQIWRFDITSGEYWDGNGQLPSDFIVGQVIADLAEDNSADHARRFYHSPDVALIKEDGVEKVVLAIGSGYRARPNDRNIHDRFYVMKIPSPYEPLGDFTALDHDDLLDVTGTFTPDLTGKQGWWFAMEREGEKVLSSPLIVDGLIEFTTYDPTARLVGCEVQPGTAREYLVNLKNGAAIMHQSGELTRSRDLGAGTIVGDPGLIFTEDGGGSVFLGAEKGIYSITSNRATRTFWYEKE